MEKSHLFIDATNTRQKVCVLIRPDQPAWCFPKIGGVPVTRDLLLPTCTIPVESGGSFSVGHPVIVKTDIAGDFIAELKMTGKWKTTMTSLKGITRYHRITDVDAANDTITIDTRTK